MPLTAIEGPGGIVPAIAEALNHPLTGTEPVEDQLKRLLRGRKLLLVLDNFEHLVAGGPMLVGWLAAAPGLKLMITSRERLNLAEEWLYHVDGFSPDQAIAFFSQAAQRMDPRRYLVGQSQAVAEICRLADGLPLALELAASLTRVMSCDQIVE